VKSHQTVAESGRICTD